MPITKPSASIVSISNTTPTSFDIEIEIDWTQTLAESPNDELDWLQSNCSVYVSNNAQILTGNFLNIAYDSEFFRLFTCSTNCGVPTDPLPAGGAIPFTQPLQTFTRTITFRSVWPVNRPPINPEEVFVYIGANLLFWEDGVPRIPGNLSIAPQDPATVDTSTVPLPVEPDCTVGISLVSKTDETAPGANDGTIEVVATGLQGNATYSIDGGTPQASPIFSSLIPKTYTLLAFDDIVANCQSVSLQVTILPDETQPVPIQDVTEELCIEFSKCENDDAVYLAWINSLGGWDYWLFNDNTDNHTRKVRTRTRENFINNVKDLESAQTNKGFTQKFSTPFKRMGAGNVDPENIEGFEELFTSSKVLMLVSEKSVRPPQWMEVKVIDGNITTNNSLSEIEIEIELPDLNRQSN